MKEKDKNKQFLHWIIVTAISMGMQTVGNVVDPGAKNLGIVVVLCFILAEMMWSNSK